MDNIKAKQQLIDKVKESTNILVTVSDSPSVDALSAAIGFTLMLDKLGKYVTAVFSGTVPPAIAFLEPDKVLDDTTDSLRDFIIALDKEKADHLRYKVEGDSVKIFITPYKTTITSDDLQFSQGDYNVELVIALGVDDQKHLDKALESHGQILHDATVVTVTAGDQTSTLGGIDWHDDQATSLSEMLFSLVEPLRTDKKKDLLDSEIATAFLTGIVAQTERFSNQHTTANVMTVASQLMAAGADQQLIATKLDETYDMPTQVDEDTPELESEPEPTEQSTITTDGTLKIEQHEEKLRKPEPESAPEPEPEPEPEPTPTPVAETQAAVPTVSPFETLENLDKRVKDEEQTEAAKAAQQALNRAQLAPAVADPAILPLEEAEPTLGGTLNATTEQAADDARREAENDQNKTILTHSYLSPSPEMDAQQPVGLEDMGTTEQAGSAYLINQEPTITPQPAVQPTPTDFGLPMPPPIPDFSQGVPTGPYAPAAQPAILGDILTSEVPNQPQALQAPVPYIPTGPYAPPPVTSDDPGQFQIPSQP